MLLDARAVAEGDALVADLCVVGAGAAGITVALECADTPTQVVLLEQGGLVDHPGNGSLYRIVDGLPPHLTLDPIRRAYFGGSTNHWFGNCRPLDAADFERRAWIPHSGWPVHREELARFYEEAQALCGLGGLGLYDAEACRPHLAHPPLVVDPGILANRVVHTCPSLSFGERFRPRLRDAENVRVLAHARVTRLETTARGEAIRAARVATTDGRRLRVEARVFVLAAGGVENPRLLLESDDADPRGLGNAHDVVGRFFMEHPYVDIPLGEWRTGRDLGFYGDGQQVGASIVWGQLSLSDAYMRSERAPGQTLWFPRVDPVTPSEVSAARLGHLLRGRARPDEPLEDVLSVLRDPCPVVRRVWRRLRRRTGPGAPGAQALRVQLEQIPDPLNRVRLSADRDRLGQRRANVVLRLTDEERQRHARSLDAAASALGLDGPRIAGQMEAILRAGRRGFFWHHMGATRMHEDPRQGVVDGHGRVHGVANLFIAGSSVFPTGGTAAPTLTILALALRLARHIRRHHR
jgi:choline dehydrogenase-like flavoprotein